MAKVEDQISVRIALTEGDCERIRKFVEEAGVISGSRTLVVDTDAPLFSDEEKEKWLSVFLDPGGITSHTFVDRDGKWRARATCADGSQIYTPLFHTAHGVFTWFADTSMAIRMAMPCTCEQCRRARGE